MSPRHVVILSVSAGAGHVRAAQALAAAGERDWPAVRFTHLDVMDFVSEGFRKLYADSYLRLIEKAPLLWAFLYQQTDRPAPSSALDRLRRAVERLNTRRLDTELRRLAPEAIVCTHFLPAELLSRRIGRGHATAPVRVQITDFDVHGLWVQPHMRGYFVASEEIACRIAARGVPAERVHVTGIPVMPQFAAAPPRAECAAELGLDPTRPAVLMMSGAAGLGGMERLAGQLLDGGGDFQLLALAGRNASTLEALRVLAPRHPGRLFPLGYTQTIERLMAAADVAITKPGGLTTAECLAIRLPMIVVAPIPGQEERNADFLLESAVALKAIDAAALQYKLHALLADPGRLAAMRERMGALARPEAAADALRYVLGSPGPSR